jgi:hypothetical protein
MTPLRTAIIAALNESSWRTARDICAAVEGWCWKTMRNELSLMSKDGLIDQELDQLTCTKVRARYRLRVLEAA